MSAAALAIRRSLDNQMPASRRILMPPARLRNSHDLDNPIHVRQFLTLAEYLVSADGNGQIPERAVDDFDRSIDLLPHLVCYTGGVLPDRASERAAADRHLFHDRLLPGWRG